MKLFVEAMQGELTWLSQVMEDMRSSQSEVRHRTTNTKQPRTQISNDEVESYNNYEKEYQVRWREDKRDNMLRPTPSSFRVRLEYTYTLLSIK